MDLGSVGVRFMAWAEEPAAAFSLVEHPIPPKTLVAPVHIHEREDEYSFVLEGPHGRQAGRRRRLRRGRATWRSSRATSGIRSGTRTRPRAGSSRSSPRAGFEHFFDEMATLMAGEFDPEKLAELGAGYGHYFKPETVRSSAPSTVSRIRCWRCWEARGTEESVIGLIAAAGRTEARPRVSLCGMSFAAASRPRRPGSRWPP